MSRGKGSWTRSRGIVLGAQKSLFPLDKSALKLEIYPDSTGTLLSIKSKTIQSSSEDMGAGRRVCFALGVYLARHSADPLLCWVRPLWRNFQGAFEARECVDFHFNDKLAIPLSIGRRIQTKEENEKVHIATATFSAILPIDPDISSCSFPWYKS